MTQSFIYQVGSGETMVGLDIARHCILSMEPSKYHSVSVITATCLIIVALSIEDGK